MATCIIAEIELSLPVPPSLNSKYKTTKTGKFYVVNEHKSYTKRVREICVTRRIKPLKGPIGMEIKWYRKTKQGDIDSKLKTLLDALAGCAYEDDSQITELSIYRLDTESFNPRVVVKVIDLSLEEIFTDQG